MTKTIFIVNPKSGNGQGKVCGEKLAKLLPQLEGHFEIIYTEYPKHATEIASRYFKSDDVALIAVGGDGTMNEVLNGIHAGVTMGLIPSGSGNDFYRLIDPKVNSFKELVKATLDGKRVMIDYGIMNGYKFLGSFSVGMDANVVNRAGEIQKNNKKVRKSAYLRAVAAELMKHHSFDAYMETDQLSIHQRVLLVSALNSRNYGGGFTPAPFADIQDGLFDVALVDDLPMYKIIPLLPLYMSGKHSGRKELKSFRTNRFTLKCDVPIYAQCDGELFKEKMFELQVIHKGLSFIMPKGTTYEYRK